MKTENITDFISAWAENYREIDNQPTNRRFVNIPTDSVEFESLKGSIATLIEGLSNPKSFLKDGSWYCVSYDIGKDKVLSFNFTFETNVVVKEYRGLPYETREPRCVEIFNIEIDDVERGLCIAFEDVRFSEVALSSKLFDSIVRGLKDYKSRVGGKIVCDFESWLGVSQPIG